VLGEMHRFNDVAWNLAHHDIQGPLQGVLRRPAARAKGRGMGDVLQPA
jgi:hypothetical protein